IVDDALVYISDKVTVGMTEKELNLMLYTYMAKIPGVITDEFIILVLGAENSANPHGVSGDYTFKEGDIILIDFCAYYEHYWSDITRCFFLGHIGNHELEKIYNIAKNANLAAIAAVQPGVAAKTIDEAARKYITDAGYGEYFLHRTGHGLGLSVHEEPYITPVNDLILEEGMTFTIEPGIYLEGIGGVRVEDDILVTKDGCRVLTHTSKNLCDHLLKCM
ncbi:MAG: M24 family metallopeptidase, partial [Cloacibacillus sp.]